MHDATVEPSPELDAGAPEAHGVGEAALYGDAHPGEVHSGQARPGQAHPSEMQHGDAQRGPIDVILLLAVATLVGVGTLAVYIGSSWRAELRFGDDMFFVNQHLFGVALGVVALLIGNRFDYRWYRKLARPILFISVLLLFMTLLPGIGIELNGARRWLNLGVIHFQPAELAKVAVCVFMAYSMERRYGQVHAASTYYGHGVALALLTAPLLLQPDFSSAVIVTGIVACMLFVGGARWMHFVATAGVLVILALAAIYTEGYRVRRVMTWIDPWADASGDSWQLTNAWVALARGGFSGTGFGEGFSMFGFVPEMHNDFVAAVIAEEFGWRGFTVFVLIFAIVAWRGFRIAKRCDDTFGAYLAFGLTTLIIGQALVNLGVVTGVLPTTGLTLPFVSFGRSSLIILLFVVGILLNISQNNADLRSDYAERKQSTLSAHAQRQQEARWRQARLDEIRAHTGRDHER